MTDEGRDGPPMSRRDLLGGLAGGAALLVVGESLAGCGSSGVFAGGSQGGALEGEGLTKEQADASDSSTPLPPTPLEQIVLADGRTVQELLDEFDRGGTMRHRSGRHQTAQEYKDLAIARMVARGLALTDRAAWQVPPEGTGKPAQDGLAYSYGSKNPSVRQRPPAGCCQDLLQGLDCSGLVYQCALAANVNIPDGRASAQSHAQTWNSGLPAAWSILMRRIDPAVNGHETGDIAFWATHGGHIGLLVVSNARPPDVSVIQSNGSPGCVATATGPKTDLQQCLKNRGNRRGPNRFPLTDINVWPGMGTPSTFLRLRPSLLALSDVNGEVWLMNADGTGQHKLYQSASGATSITSVTWSPDGASLAGLIQPDRIVVMGLDGTITRQIICQLDALAMEVNWA